jgi:tetratricopeptide (TPR) repeat protein/Zn-dependent protease
VPTLSTLPAALFIITIAVLATCVHEFGHAIVAYWGGDTSVKDKGYLTFNPLKYTHPSTSIALPLLFVALGGIALPGGAVYIDDSKLRNRWWNSAVSAAGPLGTLLVIVLLAIPFWLGGAHGSNHWIWPSLSFLVVIEIAGLILNLLPIPGLDGFGIIDPWVSDRFRKKLRPLYQYGIPALFGLFLFSESASQALWTPAFALSTTLGIDLGDYGNGYRLLKEWTLPMIGVLVAVYAIYSRIAGKPAESYETLIANGDRYRDSQQYEKALDAYDRAIAKDPTQISGWWQRGSLLMSIGQNKDALLAYDRAVELAKGDNSKLNPLHFNRGLAQFYLKAYDKALQEFMSITEADEDPKHLYWIASTFKQMENWQKSLEYLNRAIAIRPAYFDALIARAHVYEVLEQPDEALADCDRAICLNPKDITAWMTSGRILFYQKRYQESIKAHRRIVRMQPQNWNGWYNIACCHAHLNELQLAIKALEKAMAIAPSEAKESAASDRDLDNLRAMPEFQNLIG